MDTSILALQPVPERLGQVRVAVHYEGNRYGSASMERFADRAAQAAARLRFDYPTVAKARVPGDSLVELGRYDGVEGRVELNGADAERELCRWLGVDRLNPAELQRGGVGSPTT